MEVTHRRHSSCDFLPARLPDLVTFGTSGRRVTLARVGGAVSPPWGPLLRALAMLHHARRSALGALARRGAVRARVAETGAGAPAGPASAGGLRRLGSAPRVTHYPPTARARRLINTKSPLEGELEAQRAAEAHEVARKEMLADADAIAAGGTPAARLASGGRRAHPTWPPDPKKTTRVLENPPRSRSSAPPRFSAHQSALASAAGATRQCELRTRSPRRSPRS